MEKQFDSRGNLMRALEFSEYDLEANRKGLLSSGQRRKIQVEGYCAIFVLIIMTSLGIAGGAFAMLSGDRAGFLGGLMIIIGMCVLPSAIAWGMSRHYQTILQKKQIRTMRGTIRKQTASRFNHSSGRNFKIQVGDEEFAVSPAAFNAFVENREYRLYIAPHVKQILAAEPALPFAS
jgi:hypothetical protein